MKSRGSEGVTQGTAMSTTWGYLLALISGVIYSIITVLVKYIRNIHPAQLVVYRYWAVISLSLPQLIFSRENFRFPPGDHLYLFVLAISSATCTFFEFATFRYLPVGEAVTLVCCYPAFVSIAGRIFLKESLGLLHVISLLTTIAGLVFVTELYQALVEMSRMYTTEDIYGFTAGLGAVFTLCAVIVIARKLRNIHCSVILFSTGIVGIIEAVIMTVLLDSFRIHNKGLQQLLIILLGTFGYLAYMALVMAAQYADAGPVSIIQAGTQILLAFGWQIIIFGDVPDVLTIFGAILIGLSVILVGLRNRIIELLPTKCLNLC